MKNIFLNSANKLRSIWWIPIFFLLLFLFLFPTILVAKNNSADVPISVQAILIIIVTAICQLIRKKPQTEITGKLNFTWLKQFFIGLLIGATLMLVPTILLTVLGFAEWHIKDFWKTVELNE